MIADNLVRIREEIARAATACRRRPEDIQLVAVSKLFPAEVICQAYQAGQHCFGENYVQELVGKRPEVPAGAEFHFIGQLQSNKAKLAAECCTMVESVDRLKLAQALHRAMLGSARQLEILVQVNVGADPRKAGVDPAGAAEFLRQISGFETLLVRGLMTMPPLTDDPEESRPHFRHLRQLAESLQQLGLLPAERVELSMGMSGDYRVAIEEGATIIRIGTAIFGVRK